MKRMSVSGKGWPIDMGLLGTRSAAQQTTGEASVKP